VESVSWFDAILFCNALSELEGMAPYYQIEKNGDENGVERASDVHIPDPTAPGYRLPTEAEWEYACRAGSTTKYTFDDLAKVAQNAWFNDNSANMPHPVGEKLPNGWGIFDMYGNVAEWCWDGYAPYDPEALANPQGSVKAPSRVVRGGSWRVDAESCRPAIRAWNARSSRDRRLGFRVARYERKN
jgi:formylglycine-generating enzyme required for sulfatase activity